MNSRLLPITLALQGQAAADNIHGTQLPYASTLVGLSVFVGALTGSPTNVKIDIKHGATEIVTDAVTVAAANSGAIWRTTHLAGPNTPIPINRNTNLAIDVKFTGGTSPTVTGDVVLWVLLGEV